MTNPEPAWLDALLQEATVDYPATPELAPAVIAAIRAAPGQRPFTLAPFATAAALAAIALTAGALLAIEPSRDAIAGFLGLRVEGERIEELPPPPAGPSLDELPTTVAIEAYAEPVTLAGAAELLGFAPSLPPALEATSYYFIEYRPGGWQTQFAKPTLIARYEGFDLWQTTADGLVGKGLVYDGDAVVAGTTVKGAEAYWITGGPRLVTLFAPNGDRLVGSTRTVEANTLVWAASGRYFRIEGDLTLEEALVVAEAIGVE
jgi:hypothetical protein